MRLFSISSTLTDTGHCLVAKDLGKDVVGE